MKTRKLRFKSWLTFSALAISSSIAAPTYAQSTKPLPDTDTTRQELASFVSFSTATVKLPNNFGKTLR